MEKNLSPLKILLATIATIIVIVIGAATVFSYNRTAFLPPVKPGMTKAQIDAMRYPHWGWDYTTKHQLAAGPRNLPADFNTRIDPAPSNTGAVTRRDLDELLKMAATERTPEQVDWIIRENHAKNPLQIFTMHSLFNGKEHPATAKLLNLVVYDVSYFILREKDKYQRVRPTQLEPKLTTVIAVPPWSAYPQGHGGQSYAIAMVLGKLDPANRAAYEKLAMDVAHRRDLAGIHYPSDTRGVLQLDHVVVPALLKTEKITAMYAEAEKEWKK